MNEVNEMRDDNNFKKNILNETKLTSVATIKSRNSCKESTKWNEQNTIGRHLIEIMEKIVYAGWNLTHPLSRRGDLLEVAYLQWSTPPKSSDAPCPQLSVISSHIRWSHPPVRQSSHLQLPFYQESYVFCCCSWFWDCTNQVSFIYYIAISNIYAT